MKAGKMKRRITLQNLTVTKDTEGIETESWVSLYSNINAEIDPLKGKEYFQAATIGEENTVRFKIRYRSGVTSKLRLLYGSRIFNIRSVIDIEERHVELDLMCEEVVSGN